MVAGAREAVGGQARVQAQLPRARLRHARVRRGRALARRRAARALALTCFGDEQSSNA